MGNQILDTIKDVRLSDGTKISDLVNAEEGFISPRIFSDPEIYQLELEKIFNKVWVYVAHETEIPNVGDYVTRTAGNDKVIVVRDDSGKVNVFLNVCPHKGMHMCRPDHGNTKRFECVYHGWTYKTDGTLQGAPAFKDAYGDSFDRSQFPMISVRTETFGGLIFVNFDDEAQSLDEYLGDAKFYLELLLDRTPKGMEVIGEPVRWVIKSNWKLGADNFASDSYHTINTHVSAVELGQLPPDPRFAMHGVQVAMENGHGIGFVGAPPGIPLPEYLAMPEDLLNEVKKKLSPEQLEVLRRANFVPGNIFPQFTLLNVNQILPGTDKFIPFLTIRLWQPKSVNEIEVLSWLLVEKESTEEYRELAKKNYLGSFGSSGMFEVDDAEVWLGITKVVQGTATAKKVKLNYVMGKDKELELGGSWPGPGKRLSPTTYTEQNSRNFYGQWAKLMSE